MSKLTHERVNGIKTGFWSAAKKDDLVQKLGPIEKDFPRLAEQICDDVCRHRDMSQEELDETCDRCPLTLLGYLIEERS